jgi:probable blue pigment (indigoidine) exporter
VLALLNFGAFFPLLFLAAYRLPGSVAAMIGAAQTFMVIGLSWWALSKRPRIRLIVSAGIAIVGLLLLLAPGFGHLGALGIGAAFLATAMMSVATVLLQRWGSPAKPIVLAGSGRRCRLRRRFSRAWRAAETLRTSARSRRPR